MADTINQLVYSLVSRGNDTVLSEYTMHKGNFQQISLQVLKRLNLNRQIGEFVTANYKFYSLVRSGYVFLVMAGADYQVRIAVNFLRELADKFFDRYQPSKLNAATAHSLNDFNNIIADRMKTFNSPQEVDKFARLQRKMTEVEEMALKNLDKAIDRGIQISILEQKTSDMNNASYDLKNTAGKVRNHFWWKSKKIMIGIILLILLIIFIIVWICCGIAFDKCKKSSS